MAVTYQLVKDVTAQLYEWSLKSIPANSKAALARAQEARIGSVLEEPGHVIAARRRGRGEWPQDRVGIELRDEQQVAAHAGAS